MPADQDTILTPRLTRVELGHVRLPTWHPRAEDKTCPIFCFVIEHVDGVIVVDTGPREGHPFIDELYTPRVMSIVDALHGCSVDERDVTAVVNTHLHFDHCGQNYLLGNAPIWVTAAEVEAAAAEFYTVPEWAQIDEPRLRLSSDGEEIAEGIRVLHTPGHTPGHQSVVVETNTGRELIVGQACYTCSEFMDRTVVEADMHDADWLSAGRESLQRLVDLGVKTAHFSHDSIVYRA